MATPLQPTAKKQMIVERRSWLVTVLENIAAGAGVSLVIWAVRPDLVFHWRIGVAVAGMLCAVRFGIDEVALLCEVVAESFAAAFAGVRNRFDGGALVAEIHRLRATNGKLQQRVTELTAELSKAQRAKPAPQPAYDGPTFGPNDVAEWEAQQQRTMAEIHNITTQPATQPARAPAPQLDDSVLELIDLANKLLDHYEQFGTLSKHSAKERGGFTNTTWQRAVNFLHDAKAAEKTATGYELIGSVDDACCLIDEYVHTLEKAIYG